MRGVCPTYPNFLDFIVLIISGAAYKLRSKDPFIIMLPYTNMSLMKPLALGISDKNT
jgi:hypothetical protein